MSDFVTNLARRALGDGPHGGPGPIRPSPGAALASQLALLIATPSAATPAAPPPIGAIPSAAPALVMRQPAPAAAAPPALAAPIPPAGPSSAKTADVASPSAPQPDSASSVAMPAAAPRRLPGESTAADAIEFAVPTAKPRTPLGRILEAAGGDAGARPRSAPPPETPPMEAPAAHREPLAAIRIEADAPPDRERPPGLPAAAPSPSLPLAEPMTLRVPALRVDESAAAAPTPDQSERRLERAPLVPRVEHAAEDIRVANASARRESKESPDSAAVLALEPLAKALTPREPRGAAERPVQRRPVEIRIGAIDVHVSPPSPGAPAERPGLAWFEDYASLRNPAHFYRD
jgi:hypothetical protein